MSLNIQDDSEFRFSHNECSLLDTAGNPQGGIFRYVDLPKLHEQVREFIWELVDENHFGLMQNHCGRCGNSCRRGDVVVREQEILAIQQSLGISENQFRKRYLLPSPTWNPNDGFLKLENGACPFLQIEGRDGLAAPNSSNCAIYENRPRNCRDFVSNKSYCRKDTSHLIEQLRTVHVKKDTTRVVFISGEVSSVATRPHWWDNLAREMRVAKPPDEEQITRFADRVLETLDEILSGFSRDTASSTFFDNYHRATRLVEKLASLSESSNPASQKIETMWLKLQTIQRLLGERPDRTPAPEATPTAEADPSPRASSGIDWLMLQEMSLVVRPQGMSDMFPLYFQHVETLQKAVTEVLQRLLERPDDVVQACLRESTPLCYMCGECCRVYSVEIRPSDIHRLCQLLPLTPAQFVDQHTVPARFGWNKGSRILRKVESPVYSKNLRSLRLLTAPREDGTLSPTQKQCVFLERREDGFFYCQVHSHKPNVCRAYPPTNLLCQNVNQRENWGRQAINLLWVEANPQQIIVQIQSRANNQLPPMVFLRSELEDVDEALWKLETVARQELSHSA